MAKDDFINKRFSKANLAGHIGQRMNGYAKEFEAAEGKPLDRGTGTAQCSTDKGLAAYEAWNALNELQTDVDCWGFKGW